MIPGGGEVERNFAMAWQGEGEGEREWAEVVIRDWFDMMKFQSRRPK